MPASCLRTLSKVSCFSGSPLVSSNVSIAWSSARNCSSTSFDVWRIESVSRQGCRRRDKLDRLCLGSTLLPPGPAHLLTVMDRGGTGRYPSLALGDLSRVCLGVLLQCLQVLLGLFQVSFSLAQSTENGQRISLGQVMTQMKQIWNTRATKPRVGQFDQRFGTIAHQVQYLRTKRRQTLVDTLEPGVITTIQRNLFHQQIARGQVHEHQHHALEERLIHRPNDGSYLAMGDAFLLPRRGGCQDEALQRAHDGSQGAG